MTEARCALYARVSSEAQTRDNTIASQVTALHERIAADGFVLEPGYSYQDDGYSGSILLRPALERLRDAVASGHVERLYVHAPDRLARRYAHQALLMDEFRRSGVEMVFLNRPIGGTAEDDLLLQVQGVIAEYERAKILERSRRGRRHAARSGSVSALTGAPFGYRYVSREQGGGVARFEVVEAEAHIVRLIFAWVGLNRMSLREVCRRLEQIGCQTRTGATHWHASTIRGMLANAAYVGHAAFGRARYLPPRPRLRPIRGHPQPSPRATCLVPVPPEEWVEFPVPPLVDPTVFEAARAQLEENRKRKRQRMPSADWLLQGLTVCRRCDYAYYGKRAPRSRKYDPANTLRYYRCIGADGYRFSGRSVCDNSAVRGDHLEEAVWDQVKSLLKDPRRVADEYRRRLVQVRDETREPDEIVRLERQIASLRRGIGRLIDSYAEGVIDKAEFEPRIAGLKQRLSQLQERHQAAVEVAENERELSLLISCLEDFSAKVTAGLSVCHCRQHGCCRSSVKEIGDRAGVGVTTVRNALRRARSLGLLAVTERPQWRAKHLPNLVKIVCQGWLAWLQKFRPNLGVKFYPIGFKKAASSGTFGDKKRSGQPSHSRTDGPTGRFQRFAGRKPPSG